MKPKERFYATINNQPVDYSATWLGLPTPGAVDAVLIRNDFGSQQRSYPSRY